MGCLTTGEISWLPSKMIANSSVVPAISVVNSANFFVPSWLNTILIIGVPTPAYWPAYARSKSSPVRPMGSSRLPTRLVNTIESIEFNYS